MTISKHLVTWTGLPGGTGYSLFYQNNAQGNPAPLGTFFGALATYFPPALTITVPNAGEVIDEVTGKMTGVWSAGTQVATVGTGTSPFAPSQGALLKWGTNNFRNGRRVWGKTFLVPLTATQYVTGGVITAAACNAIAAAGTTLITSFAGSMVVWSRPVYKPGAAPGDPPVLVRPGAINPVVSATCPIKPCSLTGRRDV